MDFSKIKPLNSRVLLKVDKVQDEVTEGGIIMKAPVRQKNKIGIVISIDTIYNSTSRVSVGDKVIFPPNAGTLLDEEYRMVKLDDLIGHFDS